jgi:hypothetical protein
MLRKTAEEAMGHIASFLKPGFSWSEMAVSNVLADLEQCSDEAMRNAIKRISVEFAPGVLPAIMRVVDVVKAEQVKLNQANSPAEPLSRQQEDRDFQQQFGKGHDEYIERCWHVINMTLNPYVPRERIIEACGIMGSAYPGLGWYERELAEIRKYRDGNPPHFQEAV